MKELAGPIRIAQYTGELIKHSNFVNLLIFVAILSINIGIINLLPIPMLDGGYLVLYTWELLSGSPVNIALYKILSVLGSLLLLIIILFVVFKDVTLLIAGK